MGHDLMMPRSGEVWTGDHTTENPTRNYTLVEMLLNSTLTKLNPNSTHAHPGVGVIHLTTVVEDTRRPTMSIWDILSSLLVKPVPGKRNAPPPTTPMTF